ncbi:DUF4265 domain-containing protein [Cohnella abietis]|uniref:DUF4265 domain-containing protein n=1 Tax=Cohnella abietis TaxID=2507935 RepID=A0A3T1D866_9BACL|nr:DUF4265 domain-containing protein [Cohnella abietis]BBI34264.1 hypothetical protein KCTCHS21_36630 [Cohnella abietis]
MKGPIRNIQQLPIRFTEDSREIEVIDVIQVGDSLYRIEENPIFTELVAFGDTILVREEPDTYVYLETVRTSDYNRFSWLLSKEATDSQQLDAVKSRITALHGRWEHVFGGVFIVNIPKDAPYEIHDEMNRIIGL